MASSCQPATDQAAEDSKTNENSAPLQLRQPLAQLLPVEVSVSTFSIPLSLSLCASLSLSHSFLFGALIPQAGRTIQSQTLLAHTLSARFSESSDLAAKRKLRREAIL